MAVLVIAEHDNKSFNSTTLNTISAATQMGSDVHVLVIGYECESVVKDVAKIFGIEKVLWADAPEYEHCLAESVTSVVVSIGDRYTHIVTPATTTGKDFMPRVAALLDVGQLSEITRVESPDTFDRPIYAGNAIATIRSLDPIKAITVRSTAFDAADTEGGDAKIEKIVDVYPANIATFINAEITKSDRPELVSAKVIVSGGRGMKSGDNFVLIDAVADKLNAAVGASRAAVDAGFVSNDLQVGQTGKIVAPDLYIAVGISGAIQHLAGMKDSKVIVAINSDEDAPIFQIADYGLVEDLFVALPLLAKSL